MQCEDGTMNNGDVFTDGYEPCDFYTKRNDDIGGLNCAPYALQSGKDVWTSYGLQTAKAVWTCCEMWGNDRTRPDEPSANEACCACREERKSAAMREGGAPLQTLATLIVPQIRRHERAGLVVPICIVVHGSGWLGVGCCHCCASAPVRIAWLQPLTHACTCTCACTCACTRYIQPSGRAPRSTLLKASRARRRAVNRSRVMRNADRLPQSSGIMPPYRSNRMQHHHCC